MTTLTIKVPGDAKDKLSAFVKELGGEIVSPKKSKLLKEIKQSLKEAKQIQEGKIQGYSMSDLLNE